MGHILRFPNWLRLLRSGSVRQKNPIIFNFTTGEAHRATEAPSVADAMRDVAKKATKPKVVKRVEGIPPHVVSQPKP
jgi:hypothetical protein